MRVMLLMCNPCLILFLPLRMVAVEPKAPSMGGNPLWHKTLPELTCKWQFEVDEILTADVFALPNLRHVSVMMSTFFMGDRELGTRGAMLPLDSVLKSLRPELVKPLKVESQRGRASGVTHGTGSGRESLEGRGVTHGTGAEHEHDEAAADSSRPALASETSEETWQAVFDEVAMTKAQWADDAAPARTDFRAGVEGGKWSVERSGRAVAGLRGYVVKGSGMEGLCARWKLPKSASFDYNIFTPEEAAILMELWQSRLVWLAQEWEKAGNPEVFPRTGKFAVPPEAQLDTSCLGARVRRRYQQYLDLAPATSSTP